MNFQLLPTDIQDKILNQVYLEPYFKLWKLKTPEPCIWNNQIRLWREEFKQTIKRKNVLEFTWWIVQEKARIQLHTFPMAELEQQLFINMGFYTFFNFEKTTLNIYSYDTIRDFYYIDD